MCAYSTRARPGAPVSMPVRWEDLDEDLRGRFTIRTAPRHRERRGDPWARYDGSRRALGAEHLRRLSSRRR